MQSSSTLTETLASTDRDRQMMSRAIGLAERGIGLVSPGPLVGCVIVDADGNVVGEGFYVFEDIKHAETLALAQAGERARGGTAYVSLEPHAHHGRTPPCTDALIAAGITRVVCPIEDANPKVSGKGFEHLRDAGIDVQVGLLADEASRSNEAYLHYMKTGRPFVHLKLAVSLDGKIATRTGDSRWITGPEARLRVHELRHSYDAILVGAGTVKFDDPALTDRSEKRRRRQLVRVVLDDQLTIPSDAQLVRTATESPLLVFAGPQSDESRSRELRDLRVEVVSHEKDNFESMLNVLGQRCVQSVLVEGGSNVAAKFIESRLVNKVSFFIAPKIVGGASAASAVGGKGIEFMKDALQLKEVQVIQRGDDIEITGYPQTHE